jgi:hypothetical protein
MTIHKALALSALIALTLVRQAAAQCAPACDPCEVCNTVSNTCEVPQTLGCAVTPTHKSSIVIKKGLVASNDVLVWKWLSPAPITLAGFGDPLLTTNYTLCVSDDTGGAPHLLLSSTAPAASHCHGGSCWAAFNSHYRYVDRGAQNGGWVKIVLTTGAANRAKIFAKAEGVNLGLPAPPYTLPVTIRFLRQDSPTCFEATYTTGAKYDDVARFKAHSD